MSSIKDPKKAQRQFYLIVGAALVLLGAWRIYRTKTFGPAMMSAGALLVAIEFMVPPVANRLFKAWMVFAKYLGIVNTYIIVSVIYFVMIVPIGLLRQCSKKSYRATIREYRNRKSAWTALDGAVPAAQSYSNPY